jgi:tetratricopeptide (TPR) repeat protein
MIFNRFFNLALSTAILLAVGVSSGPVWCGEATQEQNLALLKQIDADLAKKPDNILLKLQHAELMGLLRRFDEQIIEANKLLAKNPKLRDAYLIRADGEANQKRYAEALVSFDNALRLGAPTPKLLLSKARCLKNEKRYAEAVETLNQVIKAEPSNVSAYDCRAICFFRLYGPCPQALQDMEKVVLLDPSDTKAVALVSDLKRELKTKALTRCK